jgi:hypothetical protein
MAERSFGCDGDLQHMFFPVYPVLMTCISGLGRRGQKHMWISLLVVLLEYGATIFRVKAQGLAIIVSA